MLRGGTKPSPAGSSLVYCCAGAHDRKKAPRANEVAIIARKAMNLFESSLIAIQSSLAQMAIVPISSCKLAQA